MGAATMYAAMMIIRHGREREALEHVRACVEMTGRHTIDGCPRHDERGRCVFAQEIESLRTQGQNV